MAYIKKTDKTKPWARRTLPTRSIDPIRSIRNIFLIFCEGKNTEPEYFKSFPVNTETNIEVMGLGMSRSALVNRIIYFCDDRRLLEGQQNYDIDRQIWCVFDMDTRGYKDEKNDFNNAIKIAEQHGLRVAYSNDSFELWFVLHDSYLDVMLTRVEYYQHLSKKFRINYESVGKSIEFSKSTYSVYLPDQPKALKNAEKLHRSHLGKGTHCQKNPCTTVYLLVKELNKCLKK